MSLSKYKNRKERMKFLEKKQGTTIIQELAYFTDKKIKDYFKMMYPILKDKDDYNTLYINTCIRCNEEALTHYECGCGYDRAGFAVQDWIDDINSFTDDDYDLPDHITIINQDFKRKHGL